MLPNSIWRSLTAKSERSAIGTAAAIWQTLSAKSSAARDSEQKGAQRAGYGQELLKALSARLTAEFGQGFSVSNFQLIRKFYIEYKFRIQQQAAVKLTAAEIQQPDAVEFSPVVIAKPSQKPPFTLSWTHSVLLLTVKEAGELSFYEIEAASEAWSIPE